MTWEKYILSSIRYFPANIDFFPSGVKLSLSGCCSSHMTFHFPFRKFSVALGSIVHLALTYYSEYLCITEMLNSGTSERTITVAQLSILSLWEDRLDLEQLISSNFSPSLQRQPASSDRFTQKHKCSIFVQVTWNNLKWTLYLLSILNISAEVFLDSIITQHFPFPNSTFILFLSTNVDFENTPKQHVFHVPL